ncbi:flippase [Paraburkholderia bannensis]|uniref:flippase n=1 Tax=Paraburkholderia bannensis TaxID=765414 RepID=UPI002AB7588B|nr:flippase [Paraburkholderia bannensis]
MNKVIGNRSDGRASAGIGRNFIAMMALQLGAYAMSFATFPYLARVLGPHQFGIFGYATAIAAYGTTLTEWGFNLSGPRAVVEFRADPVRLNELIWSIISGKAILCVISFGVLGVAIAFDHRLADNLPVVLCSWIAVVANVFTMYWLMQGLERFRLLAIVVLVARLLMLPLTFIFVRSSQDVMAAALIQASGPFVAAAISMFVAHRSGVLSRPYISLRAARTRLVQGVGMFVATASVNLFSTANTLILGATAGAYQVGVFAAADKIRNAGNIVPAQINQVFFPRINALFRDRRNESARLTVLGLCIVLAVSTVFVAVLCIFASEISNVILGHEYAGSVSVLRTLGMCMIIGNFSYFFGLQILIPFGGEKIRSAIMLFGGILNVLVALFFAPRFGAEGAAASLLISEIVIAALYVLVIFLRQDLIAYLKIGIFGARGFIYRSRN